jgi:hypothetical protein
MKASLDQIYETYVAFARSVGVEPMTFERWVYISSDRSARVAFNKRK